MLENGDIVKAKVNSFINHFAIYYIDTVGESWLIHNTPFHGVKIDKIDDFFEDRVFISVFKSEISGISSQSMMEKYERLKEKNYNLLVYDCEDFVEEFTGTRIKFQQRKKYVFATVALLLIYATVVRG